MLLGHQIGRVEILMVQMTDGPNRVKAACPTGEEIGTYDVGLVTGSLFDEIEESTKLYGDTWAEADKSAMTAVG